jgi:GNAT superfamily N-acetyltransferase
MIWSFLVLLWLGVLGTATELFAQLPQGWRADLQVDAQSYTPDSLINAPVVREKMLAQAFFNVLYSNDHLRLGFRYEAYFNPLLGIDPRYQGNGIPYRFIQYTGDWLDLTVGNSYEQFGSGMILRTYEERSLGFDNSIDGLRIKARPLRGVQLTGLFGKQRAFFGLGPGIVRAADLNVELHQLSWDQTPLLDLPFALELGASVVSKYQPAADPLLRLPENVFAYATRLSLTTEQWNVYAEWAYKINDPQQTNNNSFNPGNGLYLSTSYSGDGVGLLLAAKRIDNMDFRSDRGAIGNVLNINFLPPLTKVHTYRLFTLYPYATQPYGEVGAQAELTLTLPRGTLLGGPYGTTVTINYARVHSIDSSRIDAFTYRSTWKPGKVLFYQDFNVEIQRSWSRAFKTTLTAVALAYNKDVIEVKTGYGTLYPFAVVLEAQYRVNNRSAIRTELSHMQVRGDMGNWAFALLEYTPISSLYLTVFDEWNYGNPDPNLRFHYPSVSITYVTGGTRIAVGYAKQRAGILCVGGVCRVVPASNGFSLNLTSTL